MNSPPKIVAVLLAAVAFAACAEQPAQLAPDISEELARARKAVDDGDRLGAKARLVAADGNAEQSMKLLDKQEEAYNNAQTAFRAALAKGPRNPRGLAEYARFWFSRRKFVQARMYVERALDVFNAADAAQSAELRGFTDSEKGEFQCELLRMLGGLLERAGENERAVDCYFKALNFVPSDAKTRDSLGIALSANGRYAEAVTLLKSWSDEANADAPRQPELRALGVYTLAVAQEETGYYEDALRSYTLARKLALQAGEAESTGVFDYATLAIERLQDFLDDLKDHDAAREKEFAAHPVKNQPPPQSERKIIADALYRFDQGMSFKDKALKDEAFVAALARARAEWGSAEDREALANHPAWDVFQGAMQWFQNALQLYPRLHQAAYQLALCNIMAGHYAPARQFLEESATASPYNLATLHEQAVVLLELGQWDQAATVFKDILALDPDSGFANFGLARAYSALQRDASECRQALNAIERAEQLGYRDPRMIHTHSLVKKDGAELRGIAKDAGDHYTLITGPGAALDVPKAECQELIDHPSLREEIAAIVERFDRGEPPPTPYKLHHKKSATEGPAVHPWEGTINKY